MVIQQNVHAISTVDKVLAKTILVGHAKWRKLAELAFYILMIVNQVMYVQ